MSHTTNVSYFAGD